MARLRAVSGGNQTLVCPLHLALIIQQKRLAVKLTRALAIVRVVGAPVNVLELTVALARGGCGMSVTGRERRRW